MNALWRRIVCAFRRERLADGLREEMQLHIDLRARQLRDRGLPAQEAVYAARRQFGNTVGYQEKSSDVWGWGMWERILRDFRMGARTLRKTPGFTVVAVLTLAIGLGINTSVFSVVNAVMLRSLPFAHPEQLVSLWEEYPKGADNTFRSSGGALSGGASIVGGPGALARTTVALANLVDYRQSPAFSGMASFSVAPMNLSGTGTPERIGGEAVSANFFSVLGVSPFLGRDFLPEDDGQSAEPVVILTYDSWQRRLGRDTQVLEHSLVLDGRSRRIVGVLPRGFQSPAQLVAPEPLEFYAPAYYSQDLYFARADHELDVVGRLKPGVSVRNARASLDVIQAALAKQFPASNKNLHPAIQPLRDDLAKGASTALWSLLGASGLLLLITCVNVANLFLVRATSRRRESSVRLALGASRSRLVRLFLSESLLVAFGGCTLGILLGITLTRTLVALAPPGIPRLNSTSMDWGVFAFASVIATLTGLIFGMAPAWQASQSQPGEALKTATRTAAGKSQVRWRASLTVAEIGLSLVLLIGAGLLIRSFALVMGVDLGFEPSRVLAMNINLPDLSYKTALQRLQFFEALEPRVRALPGVEAVAFANRMPMRGGWRSGVTIERTPGQMLVIDSQAVNPGYFETLGIPLMRGRLFTARDRDGQPPIAIVNQAFGRTFLNGGDPIGTVLVRNDTRIQIVGVVADIRRGGKAAPVLPELYSASAQTSLYPVHLADFAVRTSGDPQELSNAIRQQVQAIDKDQPVTNVRTLMQVVDASVAQRRFQMLLLVVFAAVAVALAVIGVYGVLSYSVAQRTPELGLRAALGATPRSLIGLTMAQAGKLILAGTAIGVAGALALTRYLQSLLFQLQTTDWLTYACAIALLVFAAAWAAIVPAIRGARVDPLVALRDE